MEFSSATKKKQSTSSQPDVQTQRGQNIQVRNQVLVLRQSTIWHCITHTFSFSYDDYSTYAFQVFVRVRPLNSSEKAQRSCSIVDTQGTKEGIYDLFNIRKKHN